MNTKLSAASDKRMEHTCSACGQEFSYKIAHLILATRDKTTTHEVRQIARCHNCAVKGNDTYQIVWQGNSGVALDGAWVKPETV
tara:strand:- start:7 stop:258 length:252 start_codon:yes stop_codon:yes gene_type:complete